VEYLPLVGILLLFWLFIIRPASRRQKEQGRLQASLEVGDEVMLTSGIYGTVSDLRDDHVLVEITDGVQIKVARGAIGGKIREDEPPDPPGGEDPDASASESVSTPESMTVSQSMTMTPPEPVNEGSEES
jgi:preprotein translocase subunit YajC